MYDGGINISRYSFALSKFIPITKNAADFLERDFAAIATEYPYFLTLITKNYDLEIC